MLSFVFVRNPSIFLLLVLFESVYIYRIVIHFKSTMLHPFCCSYMSSFKLFPSISVLSGWVFVRFSLNHSFSFFFWIYLLLLFHFSHFHPFSFRFGKRKNQKKWVHVQWELDSLLFFFSCRKLIRFIIGMSTNEKVFRARFPGYFVALNEEHTAHHIQHRDNGQKSWQDVKTRWETTREK